MPTFDVGLREDTDFHNKGERRAHPDDPYTVEEVPHSKSSAVCPELVAPMHSTPEVVAASIPVGRHRNHSLDFPVHLPPPEKSHTDRSSCCKSFHRSLPASLR